MNTLDIAKTLIAKPSVTPDDQGCQTYLADLLTTHVDNVEIEFMHAHEVSNLWARHGSDGPLLVFAGHTDVVPSGPETAWTSPPFTPTIHDHTLYGRGAADMKGSVAAMVMAFIQYIKHHPDHPGSIALLLTSDEEGPARWGTRYVIEQLQQKQIDIDYCVVGEPSSQKKLGDMVKIGRRGSLNGRVIIHGQQGHIAYPHLANNPIHVGLNALHELTQMTWDHGTDEFQPTSFQFSNLHAGEGVSNVIPGDLIADFNFRYSPASTEETLKNTVKNILTKHKLTISLEWLPSATPFFTPKNHPFIQHCISAIQSHCDITPELSTTGGTSDGRFIAPLGACVVEIGPVNETIHQVNECVRVADLDKLADIYQRIIEMTLEAQNQQLSGVTL